MFDVIEVAGDLIFGTPAEPTAGTLTISLINGYVPSIAGDTFEVIIAGDRTGEFGAIDGPMVGGVAAYSVFYTSTSVWVTMYAVPAPGVLGVVIGAGMLAARRRRA
jgi:outer membrane lipoprotein SlyB